VEVTQAVPQLLAEACYLACLEGDEEKALADADLARPRPFAGVSRRFGRDRLPFRCAESFSACLS
jgi:hypothetical protein